MKTVINLNKNYFGEGHHHVGYSIGENGYSGSGWKENQVNALIEKLNLPKEFLDGEKIEISEEQRAEMFKLKSSFVVYKLIDNGNDKKIAYPEDMPDDLISALETARKNKSFVTLSNGDMQTGEAWGDLFDTKGRIGLSRGRDYMFPLLISFKRADYDEETDTESGESYDFLSEMHTSDIAKYLKENDFEVSDVLSCGGDIIGSVVAVQVGLTKTKVAYKHPTFKGKDFSPKNIKVEVETLTIECKTTSDKNDEVKTCVKEEKKFTLLVGGEVYSRHNTKDEFDSFLRANRQINLCGKE
ncbi:MAG: hypothetical protein WC141_09395 [Arcobacteraceae bacterium]